MGSEFGSGRSSDELRTKCANMERVVARSHGLRSVGSAAMHMCFVACGRTDAYFESGLHCWDMAAGHLLVREAGGVSLSADGKRLTRPVVPKLLVAQNSVWELLD